MLKEYDIQALSHLAAMIRGEKGAQEWLMGNGYRELAEFWDAYFGIEKSFKWLLENGHPHLAAAVDAASGSDKAKLWLLKSGYRELSAIVDAAEGNKAAVAFLMQSKYKGWVGVAHEIHEFYRKKNKKGIWSFFNLGNPYN